MIWFTLYVGKVTMPKKHQSSQIPGSGKKDATALLHLLSYLPFKLSPRTFTVKVFRHRINRTEEQAGEKVAPASPPGKQAFPKMQETPQQGPLAFPRLSQGRVKPPCFRDKGSDESEVSDKGTQLLVVSRV